jgi:hypothetical protein
VTLRRVCSWCTRVLTPGDPGALTTHTICEACFGGLEAERLALTRSTVRGSDPQCPLRPSSVPARGSNPWPATGGSTGQVFEGATT